MIWKYCFLRSINNIISRINVSISFNNKIFFNGNMAKMKNTIEINAISQKIMRLVLSLRKSDNTADVYLSAACCKAKRDNEKVIASTPKIAAPIVVKKVEKEIFRLPSIILFCMSTDF